MSIHALQKIIHGWSTKYPNVELFKPSKWLDELVSAGKLGAKSGEGFYKYDKK
jgi:3-hydroxyacyl-CoA dehydrogenase